MRLLDRLLYDAMRGVCLACLVLLFVIVALSVVNRLIGFTSMGWADEVIELLFAWLVFLGAACLWRDRTHFAVDLLPVKVAGGSLEAPLRVLLAVLSIAFLGVLGWYTWQMVVLASDDSPVFSISKKYWYGIMPVATVVMIAYSVGEVVSAVKSGAHPPESPKKPLHD